MSSIVSFLPLYSILATILCIKMEIVAIPFRKDIQSVIEAVFKRLKLLAEPSFSLLVHCIAAILSGLTGK